MKTWTKWQKSAKWVRDMISNNINEESFRNKKNWNLCKLGGVLEFECFAKLTNSR